MQRSALLIAALLAACTGRPAHPTLDAGTGAAALAAAAPPAKLSPLPRADWNRIAAELDLPLFWVEDKNADGVLDPDELASLWGVRKTSLAEWVKDGRFTPALLEAHAQIAKVHAEGWPTNPDPIEQKRRAAVRKELGQGRSTLIASSFTSEEDRAMVGHVQHAAEIIERLYAKQSGTDGMLAEIPPDDASSRMLFYRNQGPWCEAPATDKDPDCSALPKKPAKISGLYPASIQKDPKFCETLAARKDHEQLMSPFTAVREGPGGTLVAVPYHEAFGAEMQEVSQVLKAAADAIKSPEEAALKAYLLADAQAFLDNNWLPADEAWSKMNVKNSKWYLRVAPDETYHEPCSAKAGFHVSFGKINQDSLTWQDKLDPLKDEMEKALAALAGAPYKARKVSFHLPDFVEVVINAGDFRPASGATIGQSLPNWGPVANEGRGRTVAMTNFYNDPDSVASFQTLVESLLCKPSMASYSAEQGPQIMSTVLHEAAHNLGPAHEYKVRGKTDQELLGGPLASTFEELKAQTSALYFADWLAERGVIDKDTAARAHTRDVTWAFGHISRGMYGSDGKPKPYSQLASIQLGFLFKEGALAWDASQAAANGKDQGCFTLHLERFPPAIVKLTAQVAGIKGRGDKARAEALKAELVDKDGPWKALVPVITERMLRTPKASFVYSISL